MNEKTLWIILTVVGVVGAVAIGLGLRKMQNTLRGIDEHFQSPQLSFRYHAKDVREQLERLGEDVKLFQRFCWMMLAMMAEVLIILLVVSHNITDMLWLQYAMFSMSAVIWLTGSVETLTVLRKPGFASALSLVKWGAFAVWTLGMFAGLFIRSTAL